MRNECLAVFVLALLPSATADIKAGGVTLVPSGVMAMTARWEDTPKDGTWYDIYILTTIVTTGAVTLHRYNNLQFATNLMNYTIPSGTQTQFIAGNSQTVGSFPGFKANNQYRVYIRYVNAAGTTLNKAGGQTEMSLHAVAMVQASAPLNVATCAVSDVTTSPCYTFPVSLSVRVKWDRPTSVGYGTYFPTPAYGIEYYVIELAESSAFAPVTHAYACLIGAITAQCHFDRRVAAFTDINPATVYNFRVRAGTIIGPGVNGVDTLCTWGYTGPNGACSACAAGKYKNASGSAACTDCGGGTYSTTVAATVAATCIACDAGKSSPVASSSQDACVFPPCNAGYTGPNGNCSACPAGSYKTTTGSADCTACEAGKYATGAGSVACTFCAENAVSPAGSTSVDACVCGAGYRVAS